MNAIMLNRPPAGQQKTIPAAIGDRFVINFSPDLISMDNANKDLAFHFDDGSSIRIVNFYQVYSEKTAPEFEVSGDVIPGKEFFRIFAPDLLPAEGNEAAVREAHMGDYGNNADMASGVWHLDGLDYQSAMSQSPADITLEQPLLTLLTSNTPGVAGDVGGNVVAPTVAGTYANVVLLGADGTTTPEVHVKLAELGAPAAKSALSITNFDGSTVYAGVQNADGTWTFDLGGYEAHYDPVTGDVVFRLTDPASGATGPENYTLVFTDTTGEQVASGVRVASAQEYNDVGAVVWKDAESPDMIIEDRTWVGEVGLGTHLTNPDASTLADAIKLPLAPQGEDAYDAGSGRELHHQFTEVSLTADVNAAGNPQVNLDMDLVSGSSSLRLSNNDNYAVLQGVEHHEQLPLMTNSSLYGPYTGAQVTDYNATVTATVAANGSAAAAGVNIANGDLEVQTVSDAPAFSAGDSAAYVSGAYAVDGGEVSLTAQNVSAGVSASSSAAGSVVATAVRADGGALTNSGTASWQPYVNDREFDNSEITVTATDADVNIRAELVGQADGTQSSLSMAGVAATDNGQANITAGNGAVNIDVDNRLTGSATADTAGMYGIFAGYGLGENDLPSTYKNYSQEYNYAGFLAGQYQADKYTNTGSWPEYDYSNPRNEQTMVTVAASEDVNVQMDLGSQGSSSEAAGIKVQFGDVDVTSANGDINVEVAMSGAHAASATGEDSWLSALNLSGAGTADLTAANGDINLSVSGNGEDMGVVHYDGDYAAGSSSPMYSIDNMYMLDPTTIQGKNVAMSGTAGADGTSADNDVVGFDATYSHKKESFLISADEKFTLTATAYDNGGDTSARGFELGSPLFPTDYVTAGYNDSYYVLGLTAAEAEISAKVVEGTSAVTDSSQAIGLETLGRNLIISEDTPTSNNYWEFTSSTNQYARNSVESLEISAEGAWNNTGIYSHSNKTTGYVSALVDIRAEELTVKASGNMNAGSTSSSIGILSESILSGWKNVHLVSNDMTIEAWDPNKSVGILADAGGVYLGNAASGATSSATAGLQLLISATEGTDLANLTTGIAIEALNNGYVTIASNGNYEDLVEIKGDIYSHNAYASTGSSGSVNVSLDGGDDTLTVNGDIHAEIGTVTFSNGDGNDHMVINGSVNADTGGYVYIQDLAGNNEATLAGGLNMAGTGVLQVDYGSGDDQLNIEGNIHAEGSNNIVVDAGSGNDAVSLAGAVDTISGMHLDGGAGHDTLILSAPDEATFQQWYSTWLSSGSIQSHVQNFEEIILQGAPANSSVYTMVQNAFSGSSVNIRSIDDGINLDYVNNGYGHDFSVHGDLSGSSDLLYVRFHDSGVDAQTHFNDTLHDIVQNGNGYEDLLIDMSNTGNDALLSGNMDELFGITNSDNQSTNVYVRASSDAGLTSAGWSSSGNTTVYNGETYTEYTDSNMQQLYVHLVTT